MRRVLFVDDEPNLLQGLRRMLRSMRSEWTMSFAEGPEAGIELLQQEAFDVVVTDMRMPGMDGAALLARVKELDPGIARIVLSGQTDKEAAVRSTGTAHQFLAKPCDADDLKTAVQRACQLRQLMHHEGIQRTVAGLHSLPSLPEIYSELTAELASEVMSVQRVGEIVIRVVALTAKVLQLVNSAFFGLPRHVESVSQAVSFLGAELIRSLTLSTAVFKAFEGSTDEFRLRRLWDHCLKVGSVATALAKVETKSKPIVDESMQAGMLHDVGRLALIAGAADQYRETIDLSVAEGIPLHEAEHRILECDHAGIGAYLMGLWGLPDGIVEAIAYHHAPESCPSTEFTALTAVHAANCLVSSRAEASPEEDGEGLDDLRARLDDPSKLEKWTAIAAKTLSEDE